MSPAAETEIARLTAAATEPGSVEASIRAAMVFGATMIRNDVVADIKAFIADWKAEGTLGADMKVYASEYILHRIEERLKP